MNSFNSFNRFKKLFTLCTLGSCIAILTPSLVMAQNTHATQNDTLKTIDMEEEDGTISITEDSISALNPAAAPTNITWSSEKHGYLNFESPYRYFYIKVYKEGNSSPVFQADYTFNVVATGNTTLTFNYSDDIFESGNYYCKIKVLGDNTNYSNSPEVQSDTYSYTKPSTVISQISGIQWDTSKSGVALWNKLAETPLYHLALYKNGKTSTTTSGTIGSPVSGTSKLAYDISEKMTLSANYTFSVRAYSRDIELVANNPIVYQSDVYSVGDNNTSVLDSINPIKLLSDADAIKTALTALDLNSLKVGMQTDSDIRDVVSQLDGSYKGKKNITVGTNVAGSLPLDSSKISILGAALNGETNANISLNFSDPTDTKVLDSNYYSNILQLNISLSGVSDPDNLDVPVYITMPVPSGMDASRLSILHYRHDGVCETIYPNINNDGTISFSLTSFSDFVFAEESENITSSYTLTFQSTGGSSVAPITGLKEDTAIILPANPTRDGYSFEGWFTGENGTGTKIVASSTISADTTVYAYWKINVPSSTDGIVTITLKDYPTTGYVYNNKAIKPSVTVSNNDGITSYTYKKDYTLTYKNNTKAGNATITVKGIGKNKSAIGTKTITFPIAPASLEGTYSIVSSSKMTYTGNPLFPTIVVKLTNGKTSLRKNADYSVSCNNNIATGTGLITVTGKGNYTGTLSGTFPIVAKTIKTGFSVIGLTSQKYTGNDISPVITLKYKKSVLTNGTDYTVAYSNNKEKGTATVVITGIGNYSGTLTKHFRIK